MSAGVPGSILDSANRRELRGKQKTVFVAAKTRERAHSERDDGAQVPWWQSMEPACRRIEMR